VLDARLHLPSLGCHEGPYAGAKALRVARENAPLDADLVGGGRRLDLKLDAGR
jgi:hypothetical protein